MEMTLSQLGNGISLIKLSGSLDIIGTGQIEARLAGYCARDGLRVIVDVSEVKFLSSIGIRLLLRNAESVTSRRGKMVLLNPIPEVNETLEITGIPGIIPTYSDLESAEAGLPVV